MQKHFLLAVALACLAVMGLQAQSLQPIRVMEYNEKSAKSPLANVGVTVTNAGAAMTDAQGEATLRFRSLLAGDRVQVRRIELAGYEVFNQDAIDQWAVAPSATFQIVLCRSSRFRELREQYQRVASASYDKQFKADKARLDKERKKSKMLEEEYQRRMLELQDQYDQQLENLENYVDHFSRIDLSALTTQEQELIDLVQAGKIDKAIALYESRDYVGQYERETREIAEIDRAQQRLAEVEAQKRAERETLLASIDRQISTYQLAGGIENWAKVTALLRSVADADTTNYEAVKRFAIHALNQEYLDDCERYMAICMRALGDNVSEKAYLLYKMGSLHAMKGRTDLGADYFRQSLTLYESLAGQDSMRFVVPATEVQVELHSLLTYVEDFESQRSLTALLLERLNRLMQDNEAYWQPLVTVQSEYALRLLVVDQDFSKAGEIAQQAYALSSSKVHLDNDEEALHHSKLLNDLVMIYEALEDMEHQYQYLQELLSISQMLYARNPARYGIELLEAYNNLADTYISEGRTEEVLPLLEKALALLSDLQKKYSVEALAFNCMGFYDTCAQYYQAIGNESQSQHYARLCLENLSRMSAEHQAAYQEVKERWK